MDVDQEVSVLLTVAKLLGTNESYVKNKMMFRHRSKLINPYKTFEEIGAEDDDTLKIIPKLKGGQRGEGSSRDDDTQTTPEMSKTEMSQIIKKFTEAMDN